MPPDDKSLHGVPESGEFYRWQGEIDYTLKEHTRRLDNINGDVRAINNKMGEMKDEFHEDITDMKISFASDMAALKARVAVFSAVGGIVGAGAISFLFAVIRDAPK